MGEGWGGKVEHARPSDGLLVGATVHDAVGAFVGAFVGVMVHMGMLVTNGGDNNSGFVASLGSGAHDVQVSSGTALRGGYGVATT